METRSTTRGRFLAAPQQPVNEASRQQNMDSERRQAERGQNSESSKGSKEKTRECSMKADAFNMFKEVPNQQFFDQWCECTVCFEVPLGHIVTCANGHTLCKNCRDKLNSCPVCCDGSTFRNLLMEGIISNSTLNCPHRAEGCTYEIQGSRMAEHLRGCQFRPRTYVKEKPKTVVRVLVLVLFGLLLLTLTVAAVVLSMWMTY